MFTAGQRIGSYEVERELGRGGMGTVYLVKEPEDGRLFALKIANPDAPAIVHQRFQQEMKVTRRLQDLHLVSVHAIGKYPDNGVDKPYLVMDYLVGETLGDALEKLTERRTAMPLDEVVSIARQVAAGLARAHAKAIIHRDIKPSNIFICRSDAATIIKLIDFGLALIQRETLVEAGTAMLSPPYASPEQWTSWASVDAAADVYSFGCTLFEMLAGSPPFGVGGDLQGAHCNDPVPSVVLARRKYLPGAPPLPKSLVALVESMLAKSPKVRPQLAEVRAALDAPMRAGVDWPRVAPVLLVGAGVIGLGAITIAHFIPGHHDGSHDAPVAIDASPEVPSVPIDAHVVAPPPSIDAGVTGAVYVIGAGPNGPLLGRNATAVPKDKDAFRPSANVVAPSESYWIDAYPVTWARGSDVAAIAALPQPTPANPGDPVTGVSWADASAYCRSKNGDLPSEEQWEWAARGGDGGTATAPKVHYVRNDQNVLVRRSDSRPDELEPHVIGTRAEDIAQTASGGSIYDLMSEVEEWTRDPWRDPLTGATDDAFAGYKATRGTPVETDVALTSTDVPHRSRLSTSKTSVRSQYVGFRCVYPAR